MTDISSFAAAALTSHEAGALMPTPSTLPPSDLVTERFNAVMSAAPLPAQPPAIMGGRHVASASSLNEPQTLGNQILSSLQSVSTDYAQKWKNVTAGLDEVARRPSAGSMLKVQSELLQVSVQYELVGKAVSRSTQNIDTLVRMS